ncbi:MAG: hypothetical protein AAGC72_01535 [Planctomycetota bacterium]
MLVYVWMIVSCLLFTLPCDSSEAYRIEVVDAGNGWPVPLVELRTTHAMRFVTDNAGVIAIDAPELMGRETFFHVIGHGYGVDQDGFGYRGISLTPQPGKAVRIEVKRANIAKRIGRMTGGGLFAESQKLGEYTDWSDAPLLGQDSVLVTRYGDKLFWAWGDTTLRHYPLGVFDTVAATTSPRPFESFKPPLKPVFDHMVDSRTGRPRGVAKMPGDGPTWITGLIALPDKNGEERLVATYTKIRRHLHAYERGLCEWDDQTESFKRVRILWREGDARYTFRQWHDCHPFIYLDDLGEERVGMGNPLPKISFPATYESWRNPDTWRTHRPQPTLRDAAGGANIHPHTGAVTWNPYRKKWITVFMQKDGSPSPLGEVWYAESDEPFGVWGPAVKILTHDNYTFYNIRIHHELTDKEDGFIVFEGTYTAEFADDPEPTPRYNYNQVLYRLDLDDPKLAPAHKDY